MMPSSLQDALYLKLHYVANAHEKVSELIGDARRSQAHHRVIGNHLLANEIKHHAIQQLRSLREKCERELAYLDERKQSLEQAILLCRRRIQWPQWPETEPAGQLAANPLWYQNSRSRFHDEP